MIRILTAAAFAASCATAALAQQAQPVTDPAMFAQLAGVSNQFEIQSSQLALEKGVEGEVADFARQMVEDHTAAGEKMTSAAERNGVAVPVQLDAEHQAKVDMLKAAEGDQLVKGYVDLQVEAHQKAVALFEGFSTGGPDGPLKQFAAETLPKLREHAEHVQGIAGK